MAIQSHFMPARSDPTPTRWSPVAADAMRLDEVAALDRLGGSSALFAIILKSFVSDLAAYPSTVQAHLRRHDAVAAARALHTLKGLAATVGASYLAQQAIALERDVKSGTADTDAMVASLQALVDCALPVLHDAVRRHAAV